MSVIFKHSYSYIFHTSEFGRVAEFSCSDGSDFGDESERHFQTSRDLGGMKV
jgi:hypothetical protein